MQALKVGLVIGNQQLWNEAQECLRSLPVHVVLQQPALGDVAAFVDQLDQQRPDVLLLDITGLPEPLDVVLRKIKSVSGSPMIIALSSTADPETILSAIRAGANEFLYPPFDAGLHRALERFSGERTRSQAPQRQRGKALGFVSGKGGCGATTIACHVAVEIQRVTGQEVLLADLDLASGMVGFLMKSTSSYSILDAVKNVHRLDQSYWKALVSNGQAHVEVIAAPPAASFRGDTDPQAFRRVLRFLRTIYDWVIVDLGRSLNPLTFALLEDIDETYLVSTLDLPSLHQTKQVVQALLEAGHGRQHLHLLMNRMPKRPDLAPAEVKRALGVPIYETLPNNYPELYEAYAEGNLLPTGSELGKYMTGLAQKIAGVEAKEKTRSKLNLSLFTW
jgi:pilus assembly protein CpaE